MQIRTSKTPEQLDLMVKELSNIIYIRTDDHRDVKREATETEKRTLYTIFYSALAAMNYYRHQSTKEIMDAHDKGIINMAEFTVDRLIPNVNGYLSVYIPLHDVIKTWGKEEY